ncbi:hypothetical protein D3C73_633780 [compost metagenome]
MFDSHGVDDRLAQTFCDDVSFVAARHRSKRHELVTALAGHELTLSQGRLQAPRDSGQQLIAHGVTIQIIDLLKPIQVQREQRQSLPVGGGLLLARQPLQERGAIGQSGQTVISRQMGDAPLLRQARTQVANGVDYSPTASGLVAPGGQFDGNILVAQPQRGLDHSSIVKTMRVLNPSRQAGPDQGVARGLDQFGQHLIGGDDGAVALDGHAVHRGLDEILLPMGALRVRLAVQRVAGRACAQDKKAHAGHAQSQDVAPVVASNHPVQGRQGNYGHRRHGGEVQTDDAQHHGGPALQTAKPIFAAGGQSEGYDAEEHGTDNRSG